MYMYIYMYMYMYMYMYISLYCLTGIMGESVHAYIHT